MTEPVPALVTLHVWRVPRRRIPSALLRMAADRRPIGHTPGLRFGKMLGTGNGATFSARDSDPTRWALLSTWATPNDATAFEDSPTARRWSGWATEQWRADLLPLASRGQWSGHEPFGQPQASRWTGPVAALTRARLRPAKMATFWQAVPPVALDLWSPAGTDLSAGADLSAGTDLSAGAAQRPGLRAAIGIGEAPAMFQGTFSVWDGTDALTEFAYRGAAHRAAIRRTAEENWYAEDLFARFGVLGSSGMLSGSDPLA